MNSLVDFSSPTITKNDLRLLKQEIESTADVVNFGVHIPDRKEGTDNDLAFTKKAIFQKTKFPPIKPFPSFSLANASVYQMQLLPPSFDFTDQYSIIRVQDRSQWDIIWAAMNVENSIPYQNSSINPPLNILSSTFATTNQSFLRSVIIELQNDLDFRGHNALALARISEGFNVLIRSKEGSKFKITFNDAYLGASPAFITNQTTTGTRWGYSGLCIKDLIFVHDQSNSSKSTIDLIFDTSIGVNTKTLTPSATFDVHFDNVDFYYSKEGVHFSGTQKDLQFTKCNFFNSGTTTNERAIFMQGVKNLTVSNCKFKSLNNGTTPSLVLVFFGDNSSDHQKVRGDLFFDNIIDETEAPHSTRQFINMESAATLLPTVDYRSFDNVERLPRKINFYVKDCILKSASSAHILIYGHSNPFNSFDNIILYNNAYENNLGKGLLFWDFDSNPASSGTVRGKVYSQSNNANQKFYRPATLVSPTNETKSLLSLTRELDGENLHFVYASGKAGGGSTITALKTENFIYSSFWVDRPLTLSGQVVLDSVDIPLQYAAEFIIINNLNNTNYNNFKLVATLAPAGTNAGIKRIGLAVSTDSEVTYKNNMTVNISEWYPNASNTLFVNRNNFTSPTAFPDTYDIATQLNAQWSSKLTFKWRRPLYQNGTSQDPIVILYNANQTSSGVGTNIFQGRITLNTAKSEMPTTFKFSALVAGGNAFSGDRLYGRYTLFASY